MRERLLHAPAWVWAVTQGGFFAVLWAAWSRFLDDQSWTHALVAATGAGVIFGAITGPALHRQLRGVRGIAARSPGGLSREVRQAARRGPAPSDPTVRQAACDLLEAQLEPIERQRRWTPPFFALLTALTVFLALTDSAWWWLAVVATVGVAVKHRYSLLRLRRRLELLGGRTV